MSRLLLAVVTAQPPSYYLQQLLNGIFSGSVYALFAVGYTLVFGVLDILNLAQSAVFTLGAVIALVLLTNFGLPFWLAVLLAIAVTGAIGYGLDLVAFRPLRHRGAPHISSLSTRFSTPCGPSTTTATPSCWSSKMPFEPWPPPTAPTSWSRVRPR
jgi:hypothetical protein